ncbi:MAG TPA: hypothetical protein VGR00_12775 [Thermoanaerobaculia bacterium]|nr:hypothetical protein [Thermoanaerobaculia bacterium]
MLLSPHPKSWSARENAAPGAVVRTGTAVQWDGRIFEVVRVEPREGGGFRHVLQPWDEREIVRTFVEYGVEPSRPVDSREAATEGISSESGSAFAAKWRRLSPRYQSLALGFVPAVLLGWFFPFRIMGEGISFLVHELGHTATAWLFGCSALPAVVMTIAFEQSRFVAALVWMGIIAAAVKYRSAPRWNVLFGAAAVVYPVIAFTRWHQTAFDLGGHLAEMLFAAWAFQRAVNEERPEFERGVMAFFAFYLVMRNVRLFGGVALSAEMRTDYLTIAIADQNDMVKVANATGLSLPTLGALTAIAFLVVPLGVLIWAIRNPTPTTD